MTSLFTYPSYDNISIAMMQYRKLGSQDSITVGRDKTLTDHKPQEGKLHVSLVYNCMQKNHRHILACGQVSFAMLNQSWSEYQCPEASHMHTLSIHGVLLSSLLDTPGFTERGGAKIQLIKTVSQLVCIVMLSFRSQIHAPPGLCKYAVCPLPPSRIVLQKPCPSVDQFPNLLLPNIPFKTNQNVPLNTSLTNQMLKLNTSTTTQLAVTADLQRSPVKSCPVLQGRRSQLLELELVIFSHTSRLQKEACVIHWCTCIYFQILPSIYYILYQIIHLDLYSLIVLSQYSAVVVKKTS